MWPASRGHAVGPGASRYPVDGDDELVDVVELAGAPSADHFGLHGLGRIFVDLRGADAPRAPAWATVKPDEASPGCVLNVGDGGTRERGRHSPYGSSSCNCSDRPLWKSSEWPKIATHRSG